jgi:hypothetical protein
MSFLDLIQQSPHTPAFGSQDGQPKQQEKNPLQNGEKKPYETQN